MVKNVLKTEIAREMQNNNYYGFDFFFFIFGILDFVLE